MMLTFDNDPALKASLVAEGRKHRDMDMLVKGTYGAHGKACSIGCYFHGSHAEGLERFKIPKRVSCFADVLFELLPEPENIEWHTQWTGAIPVGASEKQITLVMDRLQLFSLRQKSEWFGDEYNHHIKVIMGLFDRAVQGDDPTEKEWDDAAWAARDAWDALDAWDAWAAWDARDALDARDARDALDALDARAALDAWDARAAWDAWAALDARATHYCALRDEYLKEMAAIT